MKRTWRITGGWVYASIAIAVAIATGAAIYVGLVIDAGNVTSLIRLRQALPSSRVKGYVSSQACRTCHPAEYASWHSTYHRSMTQTPAPGNVLAEIEGGLFRGETSKVGSNEFVLHRRNNEYWVQMLPFWRRDWKGLSAPHNKPIDLRIVLMTGSHRQQAYWVTDPLDDEHELYPTGIIWLRELGRHIPQKDVFLSTKLPSNPKMRWRKKCIFCHSTGFEWVTRTGSSRMRSPPYGEPRVAEYGISCEACHGAGAQHVRKNRNPFRRFALHMRTNDDSTIVNPEGLGAVRSIQACAVCHMAISQFTSKFYDPGRDDLADIRRPPPVEVRNSMPSRFWPDRMVRVGGREGPAVFDSPCFSKGGSFTCLSCHSMHKSAPDDQLKAGMRTNEACLQCHQDYRTKLSDHTHHRANSSGSRCYNCHMPYTSWNLIKATRSHQISNPDLAKDNAAGRPNACNLCHLDQTLSWTSNQLNQWYGHAPVQVTTEQKTVGAGPLWALKGDAIVRGLVTWSMGWQPAQQAAGTGWMAPYLAYLAADPYVVVRIAARRSLRSLRGFEAFDFDPIDIKTSIWQQNQRRIIHRWQQMTHEHVADPRLLLNSAGRLNKRRITAMLSRRDNTPVYISE